MLESTVIFVNAELDATTEIPPNVCLLEAEPYKLLESTQIFKLNTDWQLPDFYYLYCIVLFIIRVFHKEIERQIFAMFMLVNSNKMN